MLTLKKLKEIDTQSMYQIYDRWPSMAESCYNKSLTKVDLKDIDHVVFAGMGGSGAIGDTFSSILSKLDMHVTVVKGYLLPKTVNNRTLVVCTSISGETNETLSILENYLLSGIGAPWFWCWGWFSEPFFDILFFHVTKTRLYCNLSY